MSLKIFCKKKLKTLNHAGITLKCKNSKKNQLLWAGKEGDKVKKVKQTSTIQKIKRKSLAEEGRKDARLLLKILAKRLQQKNFRK